MNIAQIISPVNIPTLKTNITLSSTDTTTPTEPPPSEMPNPFNSRSDGFITTTLFGGISGKNMAKIVFDDTGMNTDLKGTMLQKTGINMGVGAAIYGSLSILKQGIGLATGNQDAAGAMANISSDLLRGGAAGLGASVGGGVTGFAMKALGSTGTLGTVVTFVGGMVGASIGANLLEATGIRDTLVEKFGSKKQMLAA